MSMQVIGIAIIVITLAITAYVEISKRKTFAKLEEYMRAGDFEHVLDLLDKRSTQTLYPRYNLLFMRLNAMLGMGDVKQAKQIIDEMRDLKMNKEQRLALAVRAFNLYAEARDRANATKELEVIEESGDKITVEACRRTYEVFFKGSSAYIEEMEKALEHVSGAEEAAMCQMLALQYENRGDKERARSYRTRVQRIIEKATGK